MTPLRSKALPSSKSILGFIILVLAVSGCATPRLVHLDTGRGTPVAYTPADTRPVEIDEVAFKEAVTRLVLDMRLNVAARSIERDEGLSLLASTGGMIAGMQGRPLSESDAQLCLRQASPDECMRLLSGGFALERVERLMLALHFALDTVWNGVADAVKDIANPATLRAMLVTLIGTSLLMLVAPEPVTKIIAIGLTASLIAYLGVGPVWNIAQGFRWLIKEADDAQSFAQLEKIGHQFGRVMGDNGARVLILVALSALGGKTAMASQGPRLPGAARAALNAQVEGGFRLSAALAGEVRSLALPSASVLNIALAPTAVAAVAMGPGNGIQGDPDGEVHHICTDKNEVSPASGGPWTPRYEKLFREAELPLDHPANKIRLKGHKGPHPQQYHERVFERVGTAMRGCDGVAQCRAALLQELQSIARELLTPGSELRMLVTKIAENQR